tara:strand:- start:5143 stop:6792 length:1650 start_codon:yes stop_codon:yes gene_type:complete
MTINLADNNPRISYTVNAGVTQTTFTVPFEFFDLDDLKVYVDGTLKTKTTHYTLASGGSGATGSISMSVTGASGNSTVVITRSIALERTTDFQTSGPFAVASLNTELDRFTAIAADLNDKAGRGLQLSDFDSVASLEIPSLALRSSKYLAFDSSGNAIATAGTADVTPINSAMSTFVGSASLAAARTELLSGTNLSLTANTVNSTDTNGNITLDPNGTGTVAIASDVAITGGFTATDGCTITTADNDPQITLVSTDADANSGPAIHLKRNSASPADSDVCGELSFQAKNDADEYVVINNITSNIADVTDGTEDGLLKILTMQNGTLRESISMYSYQTVFNGSGQDIDFRIDGSSGIGSHVFFMQASDGHIGIQTDTPGNPLDVRASFDGHIVQMFNDGNHSNRKGLKIKCGADSGNQEFITFEDGDGNNIGSISGNSSNTAYGTSSDYRLKENVTNMTGAIDRVKQLDPKRFNFIKKPGETVDGFLAHEAQAVVPNAVIGTKDAVDEAGDAVMQQIDHSKLVPLLTGALKEAIAKIETLETKVAALEKE